VRRPVHLLPEAEREVEVELAVAAAIANGVIGEAEAGPEMLEILRGGIEAARWRPKEEDGAADSGEK